MHSLHEIARPRIPIPPLVIGVPLRDVTCLERMVHKHLACVRARG